MIDRHSAVICLWSVIVYEACSVYGLRWQSSWM